MLSVTSAARGEESTLDSAVVAALFAAGGIYADRALGNRARKAQSERTRLRRGKNGAADGAAHRLAR